MVVVNADTPYAYQKLLEHTGQVGHCGGIFFRLAVEPVMLALCWWGQHLQIGHFHYNI